LRIVRANGIHLAVTAAGPQHGPALVLANSLGTDFRIFEALLPHLPPGLRIIRYDKRGHGLSETTPEPYAMADHVADLTCLLDALAVKSAIVLGLSIGGVIALGLALAAPDRVDGLILMDTASRIGGDEMWNARIAAVRATGLQGIADAIMERWFSPAFAATNQPDVDAHRRPGAISRGKSRFKIRRGFARLRLRRRWFVHMAG
jgi:3-oxoadipate enol-lactonase